MNTLPRAVTATFFGSPDNYIALRRHWSKLMNSGRRSELTAAHHTLYLALIGKDWRRGFTPVTNQRKLANGGYYQWGLFRALRALHSEEYEPKLLAAFDGLVTLPMLQLLRGMVPLRILNLQCMDAYSGAPFPFEAYNLSQTELSSRDSGHA